MFKWLGSNPTDKGELFPTKIRLPLWSTRVGLRVALNRLRISEPKVRTVSPRFEKERGLLTSPLTIDSPNFSKLPKTLDARELLDQIREIVPVDGSEIVEWMQYCFADNIVMKARIAEYNRAGSQMVGDSGDGYMPGVVVEDIRIRGDTGRTVRTRGFAIATTPRGDFNVPDLGKNPGVFRDLISWGGISWNWGGVQIGANLLKWKALAETPITQTVGFYMNSRGLTAPNFFVQIPVRPALTVTVRQRYSSGDDQTLVINFRDPTDYSRVLGSKSVAVASGESEVTYTVSAFPYVPPVVAEIQPEDEIQTKLEEYVVR